MSKQTTKILLAALVVGVLILAFVFRSLEASERATVVIDDYRLAVRIADNPWERRRGLSGLATDEVQAQGMLFIFDQAKVQDFWMKGMNFDLDVIWINDGKIVSLDQNVSAPGPGEMPERMSSRPLLVNMVLELPAGYAERFGLLPGMPIRIELPLD